MLTCWHFQLLAHNPRRRQLLWFTPTFVCLSISLSVCLSISETHAAKLYKEMFHPPWVLKIHLFWGSKDQRSRSRGTKRAGVGFGTLASSDFIWFVCEPLTMLQDDVLSTRWDATLVEPGTKLIFSTSCSLMWKRYSFAAVAAFGAAIIIFDRYRLSAACQRFWRRLQHDRATIPRSHGHLVVVTRCPWPELMKKAD